MEQSLEAKINSDDIINTVIFTGASRHGSELHSTLSQTIIDRLKETKEKNKKKKKIDVKRNLNEDQIQMLAELFPERRITTSSTHRGTHSMAAAMRKVETDIILSSFAKNGVVYDVGGNWATHAKREDGRTVHCCCPLLDTRDAQRKMTRMLDYKKFIDDAETLSAEKAAVALQIEKDSDRIRTNVEKGNFDSADLDGTWFCQNRFEDCVFDHSVLGNGKRPVFGMAIHSIYDIPLVDLVSGMERKGMKVLKGTFLFTPDISIGKKKGDLPYVGGNYEIVGEKIKYNFDDDTNCGYEHDLHSLMQYVTKTYVTAAGGSLYYLELTELRGNVMFFTITDASEALLAGVVRDHSFKHIPLGKQDKVVFPLFDLEESTGVLVFREELLNRDFVHRALEYTLRLKDNQVTAEGLKNYFSSTNNAVVIGGSARKTSEKVPPELLPAITTTLMVYQKLQSLKQKRVLSELERRVQPELTLAGILKDVVRRVFGKKSAYQRALSVFANWVQYSYGENLIDIYDVPLYMEIQDRFKVATTLKGVNGFSLAFNDLDNKVSLYEERAREEQQVADALLFEKLGLVGEGYKRCGASVGNASWVCKPNDGIAQWMKEECHLSSTVSRKIEPVSKPRAFKKSVVLNWMEDGDCFTIDNSCGDKEHWLDTLKGACVKAWGKYTAALTFSDAVFFDSDDESEKPVTDQVLAVAPIAEELQVKDVSEFDGGEPIEHDFEVVQAHTEAELDEWGSEAPLMDGRDLPTGKSPDLDPDDSMAESVEVESDSDDSDDDCDPMERFVVNACERAFALSESSGSRCVLSVVQGEPIVLRSKTTPAVVLSEIEEITDHNSDEPVLGSALSGERAQMAKDSEVEDRRCVVSHILSWDEVKYAVMPERPEEKDEDDFRTLAKKEFLWYLRCKLIADKSTLVDIMRDFISGMFHSGNCETPKNACFLSYEDNICGEWVYGKRYRHPSKGASVYAVRFTRNSWEEAKLVKLQWYNAKVAESGEVSADNIDKPIVPAGERGIYMFSDITFLMNEIPLLTRLEASFNRRIQRNAPRITLVDGVPGCGKSTYVVREANLVNQYVVTMGREAAEDLRERFKKERQATAFQLKRVRTVDSYLLNDTQSRAGVLHFDEALMAHAGMVYFVADDLSARSVVCQGDSQQIPFINRVEAIKLRYAKLKIDNVVEKRLTYRSPLDVAAYLTKKSFYGMSVITSANELVRSLKTVGPRNGMTSIYSIPKVPGAQYLTFLQSEKEEMKQYLGKGNWNVSTIHESQGKTYDNVILCRLKPTDNEIYPGGRNSSPYMVVGVTRHRRSLVYYTKAEDKLFFDLSEMLSVQEGKLMKHLHEEGVK
ncbi:polymerase [Colombian potato soil-borne virus]|nr:polymerase [Colombian potato soil-borne virus]ALT22299.1 polymerase [Colombian potato soil-borne virus]